jgi:hypothetical protein
VHHQHWNVDLLQILGASAVTIYKAFEKRSPWCVALRGFVSRWHRSTRSMARAMMKACRGAISVGRYRRDLMKRLAIFLDGTWNTLNNNTNVWRLKSLAAQNRCVRLGPLRSWERTYAEPQ